MAQDKLVEEYIKSHPNSKKLHDRAMKLFPAEGATHRSRILDPFRPYITHAKGSRKWDVDGFEYIDYVMGHGALILGHSPDVVVKAVCDQMARGTHYGDNHEIELEWAELILKMMPSGDRVEFFASGQEGNLMAIRLARAFTGRKKILRFIENFHGWADELVGPGPIGVVAEHVKVIPGNDLKRLESELSSQEYAIVMVEGGGAHMAGQIPWDLDFIQGLPDITRKYGTVFHLDEVVTGFRDAAGGYQSLVKVKPDLTSLGKTVSGGLAAGALIGRAEIMGHLKPKSGPHVMHSGTWNGMPITASAGVAACKCYLDGKVHTRAANLGAQLIEKGNEMMKKKGVSGYLYGRSIVHLYLGPFDFKPVDTQRPPTREVAKIMGMGNVKMRLCLHLLQRNVSTMGGGNFIFSSAHTERDVDQTVAALADSFDAMLAAGEIS